MAGPPKDGALSPNSPEVNGLRIGTRIGEFEVVSRLGEGGFSVVYLAWDHSLERNVALKEYMPMSIASRVDNTQIAPMTERHRETFEVALASFINEGKLLAQFDHPSLVKVYRFWEANGTAYMVMPFYEGKTLRDTVRAFDTPPDEAWFTALLKPLTKALSVIHAANCYHRDIAPDNVMLLAGSGAPLLLDFGAARRVVGDRTQALTAILKPGYAPIEQYAEVPHLRQGAWTDVYALAAVIYWAIKGSTPPSAVGRMLKDSYVPLAESAAERYSQRFLRAIDHALKVLPEDRTQTIEAFRLDMGLELAEIEAHPQPPADPDSTILRTPSRPGPVPAAHDEATVFSGVAARRPTTVVQTESPQPAPLPASSAAIDALFNAPATVPSQFAPPVAAPLPGVALPPVAGPPAKKFSLLASIAGLIVIGGAIGTWWWLQRPQSADTPPLVVESKLPAKNGQGASAPVIEAPPLARTETPPTAAPTPAPPLLTPAPTPINIEVAELRSPYLLGTQSLRITVKADGAGYLYLFGLRQGTDELRLILPASANAPIELAAGRQRELEVPSKALDPKSPGDWKLWIIVSSTRHELNAGNWKTVGKRFAASLDSRGSNDRPQDWQDALCAADSGRCERDIAVRKLAVTTEAAPRPVVSVPVMAPRAAPSPVPAKPPQSAECARLIQRMSLGDGGVELAQRMQALGCR